MSIQGEHAVLLSTMRNEGPYILEWLSHHFALGFDQLIIFTNNCTDNTDKILDRLEVLYPGRVKHQPNPKIMYPKFGKVHIMALRYAYQMGPVRNAGWVYVTDADEFLILKKGAQTIDDMIEKTGEFDAISFTSIPFNSNNLKLPSMDLVTKRFTETSKDFYRANEENISLITAVKTLFKPEIKGMMRPHRPITPNFSTTGMVWKNGSGIPLGPNFTDGKYKGIGSNGTRDFAQLNHYSIKSAAEFLLKVDRGDAVNAERLGNSLTYWNTANRAGDTDLCAVERLGLADELHDEFMSDPILKELHQESYVLREKRLVEFLNTKEGDLLARQIGYFN